MNDILVMAQFIYGVAFFVMGMAIAMELVITSRFRLVRGIWLLAAFGLLHGLSEWHELILEILSQLYPADSLFGLRLARLLLVSTSFACLLQFGATTFLQSHAPRFRHVFIVLSSACWLLALSPVLAFMANPGDDAISEVISRYVVGFPGGIVAAFSLVRQSSFYKERGRTKVARSLYWGALGFAAYAVVEGAIGPWQSFWPASWLNEDSVEATFGIPLEIVRASFAILIAVFLTKAFVIESRRALETAHQILATLNESMKAMTSSLNLDAVLNLIVQQAAKAIGARGGVLLLAEPEDGELLERSRFGEWPSGVLDAGQATSRYLFGKAKESGMAVTLDGRKKYDDFPAGVSPGPFNYVCAPITMSDRTTGAVLLARERGEHPFSEEDVELVTALAGEAAIAIENARLYSYTWEMTITDALTGLRNYRYLHDRLQSEVTRAARYGQSFSIIASDCDSLKTINDRYGHFQGDLLLQGLAEVLRRSVRGSDVVTRRAGDEFIILMPEATHEDATMVAARIRQAVEDFQIEVDGERVGTTMSFGVATFPHHAADAEDLLRRADEAMYEAKSQGRNSIVSLEYGIKNAFGERDVGRP